MGADAAEKAGDIHEWRTDDVPDTNRDQANNILGRMIGKQAKDQADAERLVKEYLKGGAFFVKGKGQNAEAIPYPGKCGCEKKKQ